MRAALSQVMAMAQKIGYVFLTTADRTASPHMSIVQLVNIDQHDRLKLMAWFCQYALQNLQDNSKVTVVVWDPLKDTGYQLLGTIDDMQEVAQLDSYAVGMEARKKLPQVEWKVLVRVEKILNFQKAPHIAVEV